MAMTFVRVGLAQLALGQGYAAVFALVAPRSFFGEFPVTGADWVSAFAPYNEHLVRDYGASFLALTVLAALAAWIAERRLVIVTLVVWEVAAIPHAVFHFANGDRPSGFSGVAALATLAINVLLPLLLLYLVRKEPADVPDLARAR
jgi:hypothetical protein